jgi:hypothetical protein
MPATRTATVIERGEYRTLYRIAGPIAGHPRWILASSSEVLGVPEVYLFPSNRHGDWLSPSELAGSRKHATDHDATMAACGYTIIQES